jgi:hypothetical protein
MQKVLCTRGEQLQDHFKKSTTWPRQDTPKCNYTVTFSAVQSFFVFSMGAPGMTVYDVRELNDYPLRGAELYIKMVHALPDKDGNKKELFDFNIPFDKWLAAQSAAKPAEKPDTSPKP